VHPRPGCAVFVKILLEEGIGCGISCSVMNNAGFEERTSHAVLAAPLISDPGRVHVTEAKADVTLV
jgi:hypothetical protein